MPCCTGWAGAVRCATIAPVSAVQLATPGPMVTERRLPAMAVRDVLHALTAGEAGREDARGGRPARVWSESDYAKAARLALTLTGGAIRRNE